MWGQDLVVLWSLIATRDTTDVCLQGASHTDPIACFVFGICVVFASISQDSLIHLCCFSLKLIGLVFRLYYCAMVYT